MRCDNKIQQFETVPALGATWRRYLGRILCQKACQERKVVGKQILLATQNMLFPF